ncbi:MAG: NUDIX domain-containing protein, partial [Chitinophagaceae bacterium]
EGKKYFTQLANEILDKKQPGLYNQAIMDFGAIVCKPASPLCTGCVFNKSCFAFLHNRINELPVKEKKISIRKRWFYYLILEHENKIAVQQRTGKDIWQQLYEFPMLETLKEEAINKILEQAEKSGWLLKKNYEITTVSALFKQQLSHQLIAGQFVKIKLKKRLNGKEDMIWVTSSEMKKLAFPKFINQFLDNENV